MAELICKKCGITSTPEKEGVRPNCGDMSTNMGDLDTTVKTDETTAFSEDEVVDQILLEYRHLKLEKSQHSAMPPCLTNPNDYHIKEINFCAKSSAFLAIKNIQKQSNIHIWSGKECIFGKTLGPSDVVAIRLPDNNENERQKAFISNGQYYIEDLDSRNGICINGFGLAPYNRQKLQANDEIKIGDVTLTFRLFS